MSLSGSNPEGNSKTPGNSALIAYQQKRSAVGANIECRLDDDMPSYFAQATLNVFVG